MNREKPRILIATGLFPPDVGGPAQYAYNLKKEFRLLGHKVRVAKFSDVKSWPSGLRHLFYFLKILPKVWSSDLCLVFDTFSVGLPTVLAAKILGKKVIIRTGGDFLWESYMERTGDLVLLRKFYQAAKAKWNLKEKVIFRLTKLTLKYCSILVFSTDWQRQIWLEPYGLLQTRTAIVENYYGAKTESFSPNQKNFLISARPLKWKNIPRLKQAFALAQAIDKDVILDDSFLTFKEFMVHLSKSYAVVLTSLGDISPNMILDAIRYGKPFILTRETGLYERLKDVGIFVDPENIDEIKERILWLADSHNYEIVKKRIEGFLFTHNWSKIAEEFLSLAKNL